MASPSEALDRAVEGLIFGDSYGGDSFADRLAAALRRLDPFEDSTLPESIRESYLEIQVRLKEADSGEDGQAATLARGLNHDIAVSMAREILAMYVTVSAERSK